MPVQQSFPVICGPALALVLTFASPTTANAEAFDFRVSYVEVPGSDEIRAGNHDAAIEILEQRTRDADDPYRADELTTLCALYVVRGRYAAATETCDAAVETAQSYAAYNNRGVLRAHLKDAEGALEDFGRARVPPDDRCRYVEELTRSNSRLIAGGNYDVAVEYVEALASGRARMAGPVGGADVEDLSETRGPDYQ